MIPKFEKNPTSLHQLYLLIEQLIQMTSGYGESESVDQQIDLLLNSEQDIISQLADARANSMSDLKHKISILFGETGICGHAGQSALPIEQLAQSVLTDLDRMTSVESFSARLADTA